MNNRKRKKWLKKNNKYVSNSELWNFDYTICQFMIPRLKQFKKINFAYPGTPDCPTPEMWYEILDKIIRAFELAQYDPIDLDINLDVKEYDGLDLDYYKSVYEKWNSEVQEGLQLFAKYFNSLWI